jgi:hypothetical protein
MSLLFAEETLSFCHKSSLLFLTQGVPGVDGIYIHCVWVTRGGTSPLSALSKATLPLVPRPQAPLISHQWAKRKDGLLGEVLAHLISCRLLPLWHGVWPYIPAHDCIECPWSQSGVEGIDCASVAQLPPCLYSQGVKHGDVVVD